MTRLLKYFFTIAVLSIAGQSQAQLAQWYSNNSPVFESDDAETFNANSTLSVVPATQDATVLIYPNPVASQARVILPFMSRTSPYIDIIDLRGQVMRSFKYAPGTTVLDVDMSTIPTGIYNLRVIEDRIVRNVKVVKE
jgi:hypothetical protein